MGTHLPTHFIAKRIDEPSKSLSLWVLAITNRADIACRLGVGAAQVRSGVWLIAPTDECPPEALPLSLCCHRLHRYAPVSATGSLGLQASEVMLGRPERPTPIFYIFSARHPLASARPRLPGCVGHRASIFCIFSAARHPLAFETAPSGVVPPPGGSRARTW